MHLSVYLYRLDDITAISLQPAIEIMELDTRNKPCRKVEELARQTLARRVETLLLPPRHQIIPVLEDHAPHLGNLVGRILKVGIHREDHLSRGCLKPAVQCGRLAVIACEAYGANGRIEGAETFEPSREPSSTMMTSYERLFSRATRSIHATSSASDSRSL